MTIQIPKFAIAAAAVMPGLLAALTSWFISQSAAQTGTPAQTFQQIAAVLQHPRCLNCHPADDHPRQGEAMKMHEPPVERGAGGMGATGMRCFTCHGSANFDRVPGNPKWMLAPIEMAWIGRSLGQICEQIKDSKRNGGKTLQEILHHMAEDELVAYGWNPGPVRSPAPGTQKEFGALIRAWADNGAQCPKP